MIRPLSPDEAAFLKNLLSLCEVPYKSTQPIEELSINEIDDGGMGSFEFLEDKLSERQVGQAILAATTYDLDGRTIRVEITVDAEGYLYQLTAVTEDGKPLLFPLGSLGVYSDVSSPAKAAE
jgi:hypothetical protein